MVKRETLLTMKLMVENDKPKEIFVNYDNRPMPKVKVRNSETEEWRQITDAEEIRSLIGDKPEYKKYLEGYFTKSE
jgi:hypothetical protein